MKKFMVVLVLILACGLFAETKATEVLKEVPSKYQGKYFLQAALIDGKVYEKGGQLIGIMREDCFVVAKDGLVLFISGITRGIEDGRDTITIKFHDSKEYFTVAIFDEKNLGSHVLLVNFLVEGTNEITTVAVTIKKVIEEIK